MAKYTWTVELTWDYDEKAIVEDARELMQEHPDYSYEEALQECIGESIMGEDDYLYGNFDDRCMDEMTAHLMHKYPMVKQLALF